MNFLRLLSVLFFAVVSCKEPKIRFVETAKYQNLREEKLGESTYYLKIPSTMFLDEARGKEGQLGYGLWLIDSTNRYTGSNAFIELESGNGIGDNGSIISPYTELARTHLLGKTVKWRISKEDKYLYATANFGKLTLSASSRTREGLDSMIGIVATLSLR